MFVEHTSESRLTSTTRSSVATGGTKTSKTFRQSGSGRTYSFAKVARQKPKHQGGTSAIVPAPRAKQRVGSMALLSRKGFLYLQDLTAAHPPLLRSCDRSRIICPVIHVEAIIIVTVSWGSISPVAFPSDPEDALWQIFH